MSKFPKGPMIIHTNAKTGVLTMVMNGRPYYRKKLIGDQQTTTACAALEVIFNPRFFGGRTKKEYKRMSNNQFGGCYS